METAITVDQEVREALEELVIRSRAIEAKLGALEFRVRKALSRADRVLNEHRATS